MSRVESNNTPSRTVVARINPVTGRLIDPRLVALGTAMLTANAAVNELRDRLCALDRLNVEQIIDPIWKGYLKTIDRIDAALARH
jgi:hypothetical protein